MKLKFYIIGLLISIIAFFSCKTQKSASKVADSANSMLYKIEGKGIKPSYLFGTIHLIPQKDFELKEKVEEAFDDSEVLVLELDMDDPKMMREMMKLSLLPDSLSLDKLFSEEDYKTIDQELGKMGMNMKLFNKSKPLMIQQILMMQMLGEQLASFEQTFVTMAGKSNKEILGLEDVAFQMSVFDKIPYEEQVADIVTMVDKKEESLAFYEKMVEVYKTENANALYDLFDSDLYPMEPEEMDVMLHDRNKNWIPKIEEFAKKDKVFFGVGAGHLGGSEGVVNLLRKAGFTVTPVLD